MQYNTVIFDLDGTLLNTLDDLTDSVNYGLQQFGFPTRNKSEVRQFVGNGIRKLMERSVPSGTSSDKVEQCLSTFVEYYSNNLQNKTKPYDGICEILNALKRQGYHLAIVSNKYDAAVKSLCNDYFRDYIQVAIGESSSVGKKPAPDSLYAALNELGSEKASAIYVGDSEVDVQTAHNAGIPCIGVTWGFRDKEVLQSEGADRIIDSPYQLLEFLNL
jgi:phosphoglycolate phosphatase